jgi:hypothetical protein
VTKAALRVEQHIRHIQVPALPLCAELRFLSLTGRIVDIVSN